MPKFVPVPFRCVSFPGVEVDSGIDGTARDPTAVPEGNRRITAYIYIHRTNEKINGTLLEFQG